MAVLTGRRFAWQAEGSASDGKMQYYCSRRGGSELFDMSHGTKKLMGREWPSDGTRVMAIFCENSSALNEEKKWYQCLTKTRHNVRENDDQG